MNLIKCNKLNNLNYALNSCKHSIPTVCASDQEINSEAISVIIENQIKAHSEKNFFLCLLIQEIEKIDMMNFHAPQIALITSEQ